MVAAAAALAPVSMISVVFVAGNETRVHGPRRQIAEARDREAAIGKAHGRRIQKSEFGSESRATTFWILAPEFRILSPHFPSTENASSTLPGMPPPAA